MSINEILERVGRLDTLCTRLAPNACTSSSPLLELDQLVRAHIAAVDKRAAARVADKLAPGYTARLAQAEADEYWTLDALRKAVAP